MRVYWLIEPEMSASTTSGGWTFARRPEFRQDQFAAGARRSAHHGARVDDAAACDPGRKRRVVTMSKGSRRASISRRARADFGSAHLREILGAQQLVAGHGEARIDLDLGNLLRRAVAMWPSNIAWLTRFSAARGFCRSRVAGATGENMAIIFSISSRDFQNSRKASSKT